MELAYEDLQSGKNIYIKDTCHIRPPRLKDIFDEDTGWNQYGVMLFFLKADKEQLMQFLGITEDFSGSVYDLIFTVPQLLELVRQALAFFIYEEIIGDSNSRYFIVYQKVLDDAGEEKYTIVGRITEDNYDAVRACILRTQYISLDDLDINVSFSSEKAESSWERIQKYLAEQNKGEKESDSNMSMGNIISKVCAIHPSINYLNVYNLTVFQLYDTFFQMSYMRSIDFTEAIVTNHGSETFEYEKWLEPVFN